MTDLFLRLSELLAWAARGSEVSDPKMSPPSEQAWIEPAIPETREYIGQVIEFPSARFPKRTTY